MKNEIERESSSHIKESTVNKLFATNQPEILCSAEYLNTEILK